MCDKQGLEGFYRAFVLATLSARKPKNQRKRGGRHGAGTDLHQRPRTANRPGGSADAYPGKGDNYKRKRTPQRPVHRSGDKRGYQGPGYRRFGESAVHDAGGARRRDLPQYRESRRGDHLLGKRAQYRGAYQGRAKHGGVGRRDNGKGRGLTQPRLFLSLLSFREELF